MELMAGNAAFTNPRGRNDGLVLDALRRSSRPLGAYDLLDQLRDAGPRSPMQIYRALDRLMRAGSVHKIASLSAYAACEDESCGSQAIAAYAICTSCGQASEVRDANLGGMLSQVAQRQQFQMRSITLELSGLCGSCAHGSSTHV